MVDLECVSNLLFSQFGIVKQSKLFANTSL